MQRARMAAAAGMSVVLAGAGIALAGTSDGQGAQHSQLVPTQGSNNSQCQPAGSGASSGFVLLNAPGKVGSIQKINGEVHMQKGPVNTTFVVNLADDSGTCTMAGMLHTNGVGNGNAHLNQAGLSEGMYYVVLQDATGNEQYASSKVPLK